MAYFPVLNPQPVTATAGDFAVTAVGTVGVTQATSPWVTTSTISGISAVTGTVFATLAGTSVVAGVVSATQGTSPWVTTATILGIPVVTATVTGPVVVSGAVSSTQGTSPWVTNNTQVAGVALGATAVTTFGSIPAGVIVPAVNAFVTNTLTLAATAVTISGTPNVFVTNTLTIANTGVTISGTPNVFVTNTLTIANTGVTISGTPNVFVTNTLTIANTGVTISGTPIVTSTILGNPVVWIEGHAGAIMDSTTTAGAAPANGLVILAVCTTNTVTTTVGNAQSIAAQCDYLGNLLVRPYRRSQLSPAQIATLSTTVSQTLFTAGAAGVYKDISSLVITPLPMVTTSLPFVVNITDGTATYHFNMMTGSFWTTVGSPGTPLPLTFNPPLTQSTTATTWMANLNVSTCTCSIVAIAISSMVN